jgi:hypothetical protein
MVRWACYNNTRPIEFSPLTHTFLGVGLRVGVELLIHNSIKAFQAYAPRILFGVITDLYSTPDASNAKM